MSGITPPPAEQYEDELDLWWGGYSPRTLLPTFVVCLILSACLFYVSHAAEAGQRWYLGYPLTGLLWAMFLIRLFNRVGGHSYRLTTRRLLVTPSFWALPDEGVELARVTQVVVERRGWERLLGVGRVRAQLGPEVPPLVLTGVSDPETVAVKIRSQIERIRGKEKNA